MLHIHLPSFSLPLSICTIDSEHQLWRHCPPHCHRYHSATIIQSNPANPSPSVHAQEFCFPLETATLPCHNDELSDGQIALSFYHRGIRISCRTTLKPVHLDPTTSLCLALPQRAEQPPPLPKPPPSTLNRENQHPSRTPADGPVSLPPAWTAQKPRTLSAQSRIAE